MAMAVGTSLMQQGWHGYSADRLTCVPEPDQLESSSIYPMRGIYPMPSNDC